jgi:hypothetical protein
MSTENRVKNAEFRVQNEGSLCSELYIALQKAEPDSLNFAFKSAFCVLHFAIIERFIQINYKKVVHFGIFKVFTNEMKSDSIISGVKLISLIIV